MKKLITGILALCCVFSLASCNKISGMFGSSSSSSSSSPADPSGPSDPSDPSGPSDPSDPSTPSDGTMTWAQFTAAEDDTEVKVKGVISGIVNTSSKHELYFQDADGGYYAYSVPAEEMEGLAVGMEISISGVRDTYYGVNQVVSGAEKPMEVTILNETPATVAATDITAAFTAAASTTAAELQAYQSKLVSINGVTILGQSAENDSYYTFKLGDKQSYVRISSSANLLNADDTTAFQNTVAQNIGMTADVTGIVSIYNNAVYLIPTTKDAFANIQLINRSDAEKIAFEQELTSVPTVHFTNNVTTIDLPTTGVAYKDVALSWNTNDAAAVVTTDNDGNATLTVTLEKAGEKQVTLTATYSCGEATAQTKDFTLYLDQATSYVPDDYTEAPTVGQAFKLHAYQANVAKDLYFAGAIANTTYLATTTNPEEAVDMFIEATATDGEFYLYFMDGKVKTYIDVYPADKSDGTADYYTNIKLIPNLDATDIPTYSWKWDADNSIFVTAQKVPYRGSEITVYVGAYNNYETFSASNVNYLSTSFGARPCNVINGDTASDAEKIAKVKKDLDIETQYGAEAASVPVSGVFEGVTISWASSNEAAIAVAADGTLTIVQGAEAATVTLTATITSGQVSDTKAFEVTVAKLPAAGDSISVNWVAAEAGYENAAEFTSVALDSVVTITGAKNDGSNAPKYYNTGTALRFYGKTTCTIAVADGYVIEEVIITTDDYNSYANGIKADNCVPTNATMSMVEKVATFTATEGATSIVLTNPNTSGHWRLVSITVVYKVA